LGVDQVARVGIDILLGAHSQPSFDPGTGRRRLVERVGRRLLAVRQVEQRRGVLQDVRLAGQSAPRVVTIRAAFGMDGRPACGIAVDPPVMAPGQHLRQQRLPQPNHIVPRDPSPVVAAGDCRGQAG